LTHRIFFTMTQPNQRLQSQFFTIVLRISIRAA
jgi:hypothetical protein